MHPRSGLSWTARNTARGSTSLPWWCFNYCYFTGRKDMEIVRVIREILHIKWKMIEGIRKNEKGIHFWCFYPDHLWNIPIKTCKWGRLNCSMYRVVRICKGLNLLHVNYKMSWKNCNSSNKWHSSQEFFCSYSQYQCFSGLDYLFSYSLLNCSAQDQADKEIYMA